MRKLLTAGWSRLLKSKVFWVLGAASVLAGAAISLLAVFNTRNLGQGWYLTNGCMYFFFVSFLIGIFTAVFSAFFVGTEYADGTIRNKLFAGHVRRDIYLTNLILTVLAGVLCTAAYFLAYLCVGLPLLGGVFWDALSSLGRRFVMCGIMLVCYGAIFTLLAMLDSGKARNVIVSFALALLLLACGMLVTGRLREPEFTSRMVMQEDGRFELEEGIPNSRYLAGTARMVYTLIDDCLPSSRAFNICEREGTFDPAAQVCLLALSGAITAWGIVCFRKKDIK